MSARFWLFSLTSAGAALAGGLGLGLYATTPPRIAFAYEEPAPTLHSEEAAPDGSGLNGPVEIRCKGCGPTLAQRQMASMMGSWDGYDDPIVRDYQAPDPGMPEELLTQPEPTTAAAHQLPATIERFAAGEATASQTVQWAQGGASPAIEGQAVP
ncbi:MAG TPA: hypothetical protein VJM09_17020 [Sphingobium sp.]|nr:hypothetical protein [Sphingobium sp.]